MADSSSKIEKPAPAPDPRQPTPESHAADQRAAGVPDEATSAEPELTWDADNLDVNPALKDSTPTEQHVPAPGDSQKARIKQQDDSPTVISKAPVRATPAADVLNGSLRGRRLAHFELLAPIGVGGMAAVIKGRDLQLDRTVALKILPPEMAADPENVLRFHQEARAAAKLDHENIARVFFCGEDQRLHFIAFEFVQGENLRTILERRGQLPVAEALHYILQVATGLAHAASRGVVHRDIKPSNIIITPGGRAKLVDMGLARSLAPHDNKGLTQSGVTLGTFDYISPEQALEPREADARSDIYSLGCTFYHMLTGQPPVPEGTAAKKLHCHQNEAPIDPRELNPDIPDEVAAILSRMMAKSPRDRYQRPEHLVQHLLRAAQKHDGGSSPRADGVLFVDAPLPAPPARPLLLAAFAVAAVVALVFALQQSAPPDARGQVPRPPSSGPPSAGKDETQRTTDQGPPAADKTGSTKPETADPVSRPGPFVFGSDTTLKELRDHIKNASRTGVVEIVLKKDLDLSEDTEGGIVFNDPPLREVIVRRDGSARPTIWLAYQGGVKQSSRWTALDFANVEQVKLSGIRVVIDARQTLPMTGVHLRGGKEHTIEDCQFVQLSPANYEQKRLCSLLMESAGEGAPRARCVVRDCVFVGLEKDLAERREASEGTARALRLRKIGSGGHDALTRRGPGFLDVQHCVFGPHVACFRLEGNSKRDEDDVAVTHCSAMLGENSTAFHVATDVQLQVQYSLFSRPGDPAVSRLVGGDEVSDGPLDRASESPSDRPKGGAFLIRQQNGAGPPQYCGTDNRYHNLDGFWADSKGAVTRWKTFEARLKEADGYDVSSRVLESSPWSEAAPLASLSGLQLAPAFRVQPQSPELRQTGLVGRLIGAEKCDGKNYLEKPLDPPDRGPEVTRQKIVDPRGPGKDETNVFRTLLQALDEARPGDVILIRCDGELPIKPATLEKGDVTIRPAEDCSPVLVLDTKDLNASMFRIHDAKVRFQNLEFRLAPAKRGFETLAVVTILGDGACNFEDCVLTLDNPQDCALSVVVLADPGTVMRKDPKPVMASQGPSVSLKRCFVRGSGDLVYCRASRPFRLEAVDTLAALSGSVLVVDHGKYDDSSDGSARSEVDFRRVTAVVGGNLLLMRPASEDLKGIVPVSWAPDGCLFASLGGAASPRALVSIERGNARDATLLQKIDWKAGKNAYSFQEFIDQPPAPTDLKSMRPTPYNRDAWKTFTSESDAKFLDMVKLSEVPENLARARPNHFVLPDLKDYGATTEKLPTPGK